MGRLRMVGIFVSLLIAAQVHAADDEFRKHYEEGLAAYELGEFVRAAEAYKAAHRIRRDPALLYNIAQAYRLGNDLEKAVFFYRSYLRAVPNAANRKEIEERIKALEAQSQIQKAVAAQPPNAVVTPSGIEPRPEPKPVEPKPAEPKPTSTTAVTAAPPEKQPLVKKWWLWTTVGAVVVVGVGLGVGLGLGLRSTGPNADHSFKIF